MAHRKPIGSTTGPMVFDWQGGNPRLDDYLVSAAGTWYRVAGEIETRNPRKAKLVLERILEPSLEEMHASTAVVHEFFWHPRDKRRAGA